ncbi:MAG: nitronate monooxygenase family protein [Actinomycetota bacterium]|nr:nitronate monooxygenase family protein [Actinomycetota bacterium]
MVSGTNNRFIEIRDSLRLPMIGSPLFIVSNPKLVIAQGQAGIVGAFPALNARPASQLDEWLCEIEEGLSNPLHTYSTPYFALNQIVHRSNSRLEADLEVMVEHKVPIVITSLGAREDVFDAVHSYGGIALHDVIDANFAKKALDKGADGLILVSAGAGGHAGSLNPFALLSEVRRFFEGPILLSGSISNGYSLLGALAAGADMAYVGSPFIATHEANADDRYKEMIVASTASDIVYTSFFTGVKGNYLKGSIESSGLDPMNLAERDPNSMNFGDSGSQAKAWKDIWGAGQGVGSIDSVTNVASLVSKFEVEFQMAKDRLSGLTERP